MLDEKKLVYFDPQTKKVIVQIFTDPKCAFSVRWRNFIRHVVGTVFRVIRQVALLRPEFQLPVRLAQIIYGVRNFEVLRVLVHLEAGC